MIAEGVVSKGMWGRAAQLTKPAAQVGEPDFCKVDSINQDTSFSSFYKSEERQRKRALSRTCPSQDSDLQLVVSYGTAWKQGRSTFSPGFTSKEILCNTFGRSG